MNPTLKADSLPLPPGRLGLPFIGETLGFLRDPQFAQKRHQQHGDIFKSNLLGRPTIFVRGATANRFVLNHENQYFVVSLPPSTKALLGSLSLSLQTGAEHQARRKLLSQAFLPRALSSYIPAIEAITQGYLDRWVSQKQLTWYPELRNYTLDIACKLLVGLAQGSQTRLGHLFEVWCEGLFSIPLRLPWTKFGRAWQSRQQLLMELEAIIVQRQQSPDSSEDALGLLLQAKDEEGQSLTLEELKEQILLLLFAGHETLTSAIASFCLLTAQHPDVLQKLRSEQQQLGTSAPLTLEQLRQMPYLEQVLKEVMRLIPPVGGGFRTALQTCDFNGYQIPQGWGVIYQITSTHQDRSLYINPEKFDPDRFSPEQVADRQKYGYVPFGGGIRECLGKEFARLEMKVFAVHLLRHYDWQLLPDQDLGMITIPTPHPRDGLRVNFLRSGE
jgi:retinoid hydroxylase